MIGGLPVPHRIYFTDRLIITRIHTHVFFCLLVQVGAGGGGEGDGIQNDRGQALRILHSSGA